MIQKKPRFVFKKSDRSGVFLLGLLVLFIGAPQLISSSRLVPKTALEAKRDSSAYTPRKYWANHLSDFDLYRLGLSAQEAKRYRNFRGRGKYFSSLQQFRTVLDFGDSTTNLEAALLFPSLSSFKSPIPRKQKKQNLNLASAEELQKVIGVGPVLSARIVRYRELLGGFVEEQQLNEVYALDSVVVGNIRKQFYLLTEPRPRRLHVQEASADELAKHPYLTRRQANKVVLHRELQDRPLKEEDLRILLDVSNKKFNKIKLYLYFQN